MSGPGRYKYVAIGWVDGRSETYECIVQRDLNSWLARVFSAGGWVSYIDRKPR